MKTFRIKRFSAVLLLAVCGLDVVLSQNCGQGAAFDTTLNTCQACQPQTWNDGSFTTCQPCPGGTSTIGSATISSNQCYNLCTLGQFFSSSSSRCFDCSYGEYQDSQTNAQNGISVSCKPCPNGGVTAVQGATASSQCRAQCALGQELQPSLQCVACPIGKYRSGTDLFCQDCPNNRQTAQPGATSVADCNVVICPVGQYSSGNGQCSPCEDGFYQNEVGQNTCKACGSPASNWRTGTIGATSASECVFYCEDGQYNQNNICQRCPKGTYRSNSINGFGSSCQNCRTGFTTQFDGNRLESDCNQAICRTGTYTDPNNRANCLDCRINTYNDQTGRDTCTACPPSYRTDGTGKTSFADCKYACGAGQEERPIGSQNCQDCNIGYYKDSFNPFTSCRNCPGGYITETQGSTSSSQCNIPDCQPGTLRNVVTNRCEPCPVGQYQNQKWQTACTYCPSDTPITMHTGSDNINDCKLDCPSGHEANPSGTICSPCPDNKYRDASQTFTCQLCPNQLFTERTGATSPLECVVRDCPAGQFSDNNFNRCENCLIGWYSDKARQAQCIKCPTGSTTAAPGADSINLCILTCPKGEQPFAGRCEVCSIGYYKDTVSPGPCLVCGGSRVTKSTGAQAASECSVDKCTGDGKGYYWDTAASYQCRQCAKGTYQDKPFQTSCINCPSGTTTYDPAAGVGKKEVSQCLSTNECEVESLNTCAPTATCTNTDAGFDCECKDGYTGNGITCTHVCDLSGDDKWCQNGTCFREDYGARCHCDENYTGDRCDERDVPDDELPIIIGSVFGAVFGLIIIILITVLICYYIRRSYRKKQPPPQPRPQRIRETVVEKYITPPIMDLPSPPPPPAYYEDAPFVPALPPPPTVQVPVPVPVQGAPIIVQSMPQGFQQFGGTQQFGGIQSVQPMGMGMGTIQSMGPMGGQIYYG